ncbi:DUF732 domain-containing protein [Mycolicibacterium wolinskyi]|uniref:DUF732 domain-containing protein n=1 Tax=Mycolicibacterium wolinskyi TaxID=59750 RepID=UPI0039178C5C
MFAAPAAAEPDTDEMFYLWTVANGYQLSQDDAAAQGAAVCVLLIQGTSLQSTVLQVAAAHTEWSLNETARFVGAAAEAYCPEGNYI